MTNAIASAAKGVEYQKQQDEFFAKDHRLRCLDMAINVARDTQAFNNILIQAKQFSNFVETGETKDKAE